MRSIETEAVIEERNKKRSRYFTIFMLLILVGSTAGYAFLSNPASDNSQGSNTGTGSTQGVNIQGTFVPLVNPRASIVNISVQTSKTSSDYGGKKLYLAVNNQAIQYELASTIGAYSLGVQNACYGNCSENLPEKNCSDNLIVWTSSIGNKVYQQDNCVFIEGDMRAVDAFIYRTLP